MSHRPKLAFVLPWYGDDIPGGAEAEARRTLNHLASAGYVVEVFTTCIKDFFSDWAKNHHRPGKTVQGGITVHRFPVLPRNKPLFDQLNQKVIGRMRLTTEETAAFAENFINCPSLFEALQSKQNDYLFFFIPYLFPTAYYGVPSVWSDGLRNSVMIPCLHDEGYATLPMVQNAMVKAGAIVFHTQSEWRLAQSIYHLPDSQIHAVLGEGVDAHQPGDAAAFRRKFQINDPFVLYAGRKGYEKIRSNC